MLSREIHYRGSLALSRDPRYCWHMTSKPKTPSLQSAPSLREQLEVQLSSADARYRSEWRAAQQLPTLGEAHDAALAAERRRQQAWQRAHAAYREAATQSGAGSRGARNQPATQVRDARDATPDWAAPKLDRDPREYGLRAPDGTRWIHVPWQGWQRNDGQPFLQQEADR